MLKRRNRVWKAFNAHGSNYDRSKALQNACSAMKSRKRLVYEKSLESEVAATPNLFYAYLRRRTRATVDIPKLEINGALTETDVDKAEAFARHCASVYDTDTSSSPRLS
ncbi:unnamed protein product [Echinostoma caproni]|uniref:Uncharacterized protein n=1 Tax=Echinostoma caproni TaxID=27848 RepID=A0A183AE21_9TREM|nr:unnamed protein product [Echinostoma caproni]